jgi:hypothetical protein
MNISLTRTVTISEEYLRDICIDAISEFFSDEYNVDFVDDLSTDDRKLIYVKVGAALIDFAESEVME